MHQTLETKLLDLTSLMQHDSMHLKYTSSLKIKKIVKLLKGQGAVREYLKLDAYIEVHVYHINWSVISKCDRNEEILNILCI
jgi:hypothetical protein